MPEPRVMGTGSVRGAPMGAVRGGTPPAAAPAPAPKPPKKRRRLLLIIVAAVLVVAVAVGAAFFLGVLKLPGADQPTSGATVAAPEKVGEAVDIEPVSLNLADGHYLRVGFTMMMAADAKGEISTAAAKDTVIGLFSGRTVEEINGDGTRDELKSKLLEQLNEKFDGKVVDVYYTDYVTQ